MNNGTWVFVTQPWTIYTLKLMLPAISPPKVHLSLLSFLRSLLHCTVKKRFLEISSVYRNTTSTGSGDELMFIWWVTDVFFFKGCFL